MRTPLKTALLFMTILASGVAAYAGMIGPWPVNQPYMWSTNPITPVSGTVSIIAPGVMQMSGFTTGTKSTWLPYTLINPLYAEKMCLAQLAFNASTPVTNVHAKIYDPLKTGKSGWAVILVDESGRIFDFGIRGYFASAGIIPHQYDGSSWVNQSGGTSPTWTPRYDRSRFGDDYYTMDFTNNADGTISWSMSEVSYTTNVFSDLTGISVVLYTNITQVYLNVMTADSTGAANYKWTEFRVSPQVFSPPPLHIAWYSGTDVALSWPSAWTTSFGIEEKTDVTGTTWSPVTTSLSDDGTTITGIVPVGSGNKFFRLKK